jgi:hypothetical protein
MNVDLAEFLGRVIPQPVLNAALGPLTVREQY